MAWQAEYNDTAARPEHCWLGLFVQVVTFELSPQPSVEQGVEHSARAAVLHQGAQGRVCPLLREQVAAGLCNLEQQSATRALGVGVHVPLQVDVEVDHGVHRHAVHQGAQVFNLGGREIISPPIFEKTKRQRERRDEREASESPRR